MPSEEEIFEILSHFHAGDEQTERIELAIKELIDLYNKQKERIEELEYKYDKALDDLVKVEHDKLGG